MSELAADKQNYVRPRDSWTQLTCPTLSAGHNGGSKSEFWISIKLFTKSSQRHIQSNSNIRNVHLCIRLYVCANAKHPLPKVQKTPNQRVNR